MKKIQISNFKKKHGQIVFEQLYREISKNCYENLNRGNSAININKIIQSLPENELKTKFINWSYGYDFAIFDVG
jgi:hypothetical protein